jgi:DNA-directed RNA polymerase subunit RPC12/RpoP
MDIRAQGWPIAEAEFKRRSHAYDRQRSLVAACGYTPFLLLYLLVHTKYLRPYVPENKQAAVGLLILLPGAWFGAVMLLHTWLGPVLQRLKCPHCGAALVGSLRQHALQEGSCSRCGTAVIDQTTAGRDASTD